MGAKSFRNRLNHFCPKARFKNITNAQINRSGHLKAIEKRRIEKKPETKSRVCITVESSPNPRVFISGYSNTEKKFSIAYIK